MYKLYLLYSIFHVAIMAVFFLLYIFDGVIYFNNNIIIYK